MFVSFKVSELFSLKVGPSEEYTLDGGAPYDHVLCQTELLFSSISLLDATDVAGN